MIAVTKDLICRGYRRKLNASKTFLPTSSRVNVGIPRTEEEDNLEGMIREVNKEGDKHKRDKIKADGIEDNNNNSTSNLTTFGPMLSSGLKTSVDRKYNFRRWKLLGLIRLCRKSRDWQRKQVWIRTRST